MDVVKGRVQYLNGTCPEHSTCNTPFINLTKMEKYCVTSHAFVQVHRRECLRWSLASFGWVGSDVSGGVGGRIHYHQPHDCLLNHSFKCRSKKTLKLCVTGLCEGNSPHKRPVTGKCFHLMTSSWVCRWFLVGCALEAVPFIFFRNQYLKGQFLIDLYQVSHATVMLQMCKTSWLNSLLFWERLSLVFKVNLTCQTNFTSFCACPQDKSPRFWVIVSQFGPEMHLAMVKMPIDLGWITLELQF